MAGEQYTVQYQIDVRSEAALANIQKFQKATMELSKITNRFEEIRRQMGKLNSAFINLGKSSVNLQVRTDAAETNLNKVLALVRTIKSEVNGIVIPTGGSVAKSNSKAQPSTKSTLPAYRGNTSEQFFGGMSYARNVQGWNEQSYNKWFNNQVGLRDFNSKQAAAKKSVNAITAVNKKAEELEKLANKAREIDAQKTQNKITAIVRQAEQERAKIIASNQRVEQRLHDQQISRVNKRFAQLNKEYSKKQAAGTTRVRGRNLGYKILGPSMLDTGGIAAVDMAKGFGIAYGVTGLMQAISGIVRDASQYDNLTKTTQNILQTHDHLPGFMARFNEMNKVMRQVGVETKFTAPEVADAGKFLAMAGFNTDEITKSIRPIADMALVGDTDLGQTADVVTNIMTGYGIDAKNISRVADVMTMTSTRANTTIMEMAEAYKYSASLLQGSGVAFEESAAAMGILGDAGIKGSQAGTSLRTIIVNLLKPTQKQKAVWDKFNINPLTEDGNVRSLPAIFQELKDKGASTTDMASMFHKTALQGAISLEEHVDKWNKIIIDNFLSENLARKLANEKKNTIQGLWAQLTSAFTDTGINVFNGMQDAIKGYMRDGIKWIKSAEATKALRDIVEMIKVMFEALRKTASIVMTLYNTFGGIFKLWVQVQAISMPFLMIGRWAKSVYTLLKGLREVLVTMKLISGINVIGNKFIGGATGTLLPGGAVGALGGITAAGAAIVGVPAAIGLAGFGIWQYNKAMHESIDEINSWRDSVSNLNGIDINTHATNMSKFLTIVKNRQKDTNKQLGIYIKLLKEANGIEPNKEDEEQKSFKESHPDIESKMNLSSWWRPSYQLDRASLAARQTIPRDYWYLLRSPDGTSFKTSNQGEIDKAYMLNKAISTDADSDRTKYDEEYFYQYKRAKSLKDILLIRSKVNDDITDISKEAKYKYHDHDQWSALSDEQHKYVDTYRLGLQQAVQSDFAPQGLYHLPTDNLVKFWQLIEHKKVTERDKQALMGSFGVGAASNQFGEIFGQQWEKQMGYDRTQPEGRRWIGGTIWDEEKGKMVKMSADDAMRNMMFFYKQIKEEIDLLSPEVGKFFIGWLKKPIFAEAAQGSSLTPWGSGKTGLPTNSLTGDFLTDNGGISGDDESTVIPHSTINPDAYKSNYSNLSAPKQIIVRINNLMNVDKVEMSNEKKAAVVNNFKNDMAQALLDVVSEFSINIAD